MTQAASAATTGLGARLCMTLVSTELQLLCNVTESEPDNQFAGKFPILKSVIFDPVLTGQAF